MANLPKHMKKRGGSFSVRVPVPTSIQSKIGKLEITRSLKTSELALAKKRYFEVMIGIHNEFSRALGSLKGSAPIPLIGFDPLQATHTWFHAERAKVIRVTKASFGCEKELLNYKFELKQRLVELNASHPERRYQMVESYARQILIDAGYPAEEGQVHLNVDVSDPKYVELHEYLSTALISLSELELARLGENVKQSPNGGLFSKTYKPHSKNLVGTPLAKVIHEFMDLNGGKGKEKTRNDKAVAFRYLTELVGQEYFIEDVSRDHFVQLRNILASFPANAKKLKVLQGKSLTECADYAIKNDLKMMSKANANKIFMRLKRLMQYAVNVGLIASNPCVEVEFHITEAEENSAAREKFSDDQLNKLFKSQVFSLSKPYGAGLYWVPLIALFHGFRMQEILLLTFDEVKLDEETGVLYFDLTGFTLDQIKNKNAMRRVPLHKELLRLGFAEHLTKCKFHEGKRLFPELKKAKGTVDGYQKIFSQKFSRYLTKIQVKTTKTSFHSFRKNFATACSNGEVPVDFENALAGWALVGGQGGTYKKPKDLSLAKLKEMIDRVDYPNLDLSHLYP